MALINYGFLSSLKPGLTWKSHGTLSKIFFNYYMLLIFGFKGLFLIFDWVQKQHKFSGLAAKFISVSSILLFVYYRIFSTKDNYFEGFNGERMHDSHGVCHFFRISTNWYSAFDDFFWSFAHSHSDCSIEPILIYNDLAKDGKTRYLAYPRSEKMSNDVRQHYTKFQEHMISELKPVDSIQDPRFHSYLDFTSNPSRPELKININRNESLVERMNEIIKKNPGLKRPNVLVLMIDSLSRQHFFRKMPYTAKYLSKAYLGQIKDLKGYQYFRFHGLREHHMANLIALRYGNRDYWEAIHPWERFENNYKDEGYITATASAKCEIDELDLEPNQTSKKYADRRPMDYEFFAAACDPNATPIKNPSSMWKGPFSEFRRCVYSKDSAQHQLDFTLEFWRKYREMPKVQMLTLMDGHEFTGELLVYLDSLIPQFFESMRKEGLLEDSIVFIMSDHGNNANLLFKGTTSGKNELANPFLYTLMSSNNDKLYGEMAKLNEQKLLTPHDVNRVLNELISVKSEYSGMNFFKHEIDPLRTCGQANIPPEFCRCIHVKSDFKNN